MHLHVLFIGLLVAMSARAQDVIDVRPGGVYNIQVSRDEYSLLGMYDGSFLSSIKATADKVLIEADEEAGQVMIKPVRGASGSFTIFVRDGEGNTYTLRGTPADQHGSTIFLKPIVRQTGTTLDAADRAIPWMTRAKGVLREIARDGQATGHEPKEIDRIIPIWRETEIRHVRSWHGRFVVDVLEVRNVSDRTINLRERDFSRFGGNVRAVAIETHALDTDESTHVYVLRGR